jgi:hypothetical protein
MLKSALRHPILCALLVVVAMASACTGAELRTPYSESELQTAVPMGIPAVRTWADTPLSVLRRRVAQLAIFNGSHEFSISPEEESMGRSVPGCSMVGAKAGSAPPSVS